jgi:hypothetical protein
MENTNTYDLTPEKRDAESQIHRRNLRELNCEVRMMRGTVRHKILLHMHLSASFPLSDTPKFSTTRAETRLSAGSRTAI